MQRAEGGEDEGKGVKWGRMDIKVNGGRPSYHIAATLLLCSFPHSQHKVCCISVQLKAQGFLIHSFII